MLRGSLENVVLRPDDFRAEVEGVFASVPAHILVHLIVVGADLRGAVHGVAERCKSDDGKQRQPIGIVHIAGIDDAGNAELRGQSEPLVEALRIDEEARPAEAGGTEQRR